MVLLAIPVIGCVAEDDDYPPRGGGGGGGGAEPGDDPEPFFVENDDASGHTHSFELSCAMLESRQYTYTAGGAHSHQVTLTDDDIDDVLNGVTVTVQTSGGHAHTWVLQMPSGRCG